VCSRDRAPPGWRGCVAARGSPAGGPRGNAAQPASRGADRAATAIRATAAPTVSAPGRGRRDQVPSPCPGQANPGLGAPPSLTEGQWTVSQRPRLRASGASARGSSKGNLVLALQSACGLAEARYNPAASDQAGPPGAGEQRAGVERGGRKRSSPVGITRAVPRVPREAGIAGGGCCKDGCRLGRGERDACFRLMAFAGRYRVWGVQHARDARFETSGTADPF
jgi:hypothetical protein